MLTRHISISLRLTLWFGSIFFLGLLAFGVTMGFNLKRMLTGERRQTLARRLDRLDGLLRNDAKADEADRMQDLKDFAHATGNGLGEILRPDGGLAYPALSSAAAIFEWPHVDRANAEQFQQVNSNGQPYWVMSRPFTVGSQSLILLAAAPETGNLLVLNSFWKGLMASVPILLLISSCGGYWISRRALKPVDRITATARSIGIRNLSERLPVTITGDELQRLAETCNDMLDRLESAVKRLKQFTADASHELRGPLSFVRTVSEVALRNPHVDKESREAFQDITDETAKAADLLNQMLVLARADAESFGITFEPVDLVAIVQETCGMAQKIAEEKGLIIRVSYPDQPMSRVLGNMSSLRRLLWILLDNALKYTDPPGQIDVDLANSGARATIRVRDNGAGISELDLPHIFDRFYRADRSRSQVEGNGLGLSIAKWIADTHHAELLVTSQEKIGSTFELIFQLDRI